MARLTATMSELTVTRAQRSATMSERSATMAQLTATMAQRSATMSERTATLSERTATLSERTATLSERTATMMQRSAAHARRSATPTRRSASLRQNTATIWQFFAGNTHQPMPWGRSVLERRPLSAGEVSPPARMDRPYQTGATNRLDRRSYACASARSRASLPGRPTNERLPAGMPSAPIPDGTDTSGSPSQLP